MEQFCDQGLQIFHIVKTITTSIDVTYRVITLLKKMAIYPSFWRIMHNSRYPWFYNIFIHICIN